MFCRALQILKTITPSKNWFYIAFYSTLTISISGCLNGYYGKDFTTSGNRRQGKMISQNQRTGAENTNSPFSSPFPPMSMQNQMQGMQTPMQNTISPLQQSISQEYQKIANMFLLKNKNSESQYFVQKSSSLESGSGVQIERSPQEITNNVQLTDLSSYYDKLDKLINTPQTDQMQSAKLVALYDCAVVDAIDAAMSNSPSSTTTCYTEFTGLAPSILNASIQLAQPSTQPIVQPIQPTQVVNTSEATTNTAQNADSKLTDKYKAIEELSKLTENVQKTFYGIAFDKGSSAVDASYYPKITAIQSVLKQYQNYKITIVGYQLYDESPTKVITIKNKRGKKFQKTVKNSPRKIKAFKAANDTLKTRVLSIRKMMISVGVPEDKITIAHPESEKVGFLYNIKGNLEDLVIIDIKVE